jgi:hypothetical protein
MSEYLVSLYQCDGPPPAEVDMDQVAAALHVLNAELHTTDQFVFTGGLHPSTTATVVRQERGGGGDALTTDGPYIEGKEHIGGFWVIDVDDLDAALEVGRRAASATGLPVEVRPFRHTELA